jgi:hypothetical protein
MFNFSLKGLAEIIRFGKKGPQLKKDGDKVQHRNADDSAFINAQALDPVDPQDVVTLQYFQDNSGDFDGSANQSLFKNFDYQASSPIQIGTTNIPADSLAYKVLIHVKSSFDGTNPTLQVGDEDTADRFATVELSDLKDGEVYIVTISEVYPEEKEIRATLSPDSSTQGEIDCTVLFTYADTEVPIPELDWDGLFSNARIKLGSTAQNLQISGAGHPLDGAAFGSGIHIWYQHDSAQTPATNNFLIGGTGFDDDAFYITSSGELGVRSSLNTLSTITSGANLLDGNIHCISLVFNAGNDLTSVVIDGVATSTSGGVDVTAQTLKIIGYDRKQSGALSGCKGWIYQIDMITEIGTLQAQAYYNEVFNTGNPDPEKYSANVTASFSNVKGTWKMGDSYKSLIAGSLPAGLQIVNYKQASFNMLLFSADDISVIFLPSVLEYPAPLTWTKGSNGTIADSPNYVIQTSASGTSTNAYQINAVSTEQIVSGDGYVEFTVNDTSENTLTGRPVAVGLQNVPAIAGSGFVLQEDIEYAVRLEAGNIYMWDEQAYTQVNIHNSGLNDGDIIRLAIEAGDIKVYLNQALIHTIATAPLNYPYSMGISLTTQNDAVDGCRLIDLP